MKLSDERLTDDEIRKIEQRNECGESFVLERAHIKALIRHIRSLEQELLSRREAERWIPVEETLPEKVGQYITFTQYGDADRCHVRKSWFDGESFPNHITHWRALPAPPETEK